MGKCLRAICVILLRRKLLSTFSSHKESETVRVFELYSIVKFWMNAKFHYWNVDVSVKPHQQQSTALIWQMPCSNNRLNCGRFYHWNVLGAKAKKKKYFSHWEFGIEFLFCVFFFFLGHHVVLHLIPSIDKASSVEMTMLSILVQYSAIICCNLSFDSIRAISYHPTVTDLRERFVVSSSEISVYDKCKHSVSMMWASSYRKGRARLFKRPPQMNQFDGLNSRAYSLHIITYLCSPFASVSFAVVLIDYQR